ncbi:MAG: hypothetical protein QOG99_1652, partial [Frankiales bacterium]|nr:hypothetical protein [Frankiales bacterium]
PPFDTLGLLSVLSVFVLPVAGPIAALVLARQSDKQRDRAGLPRTGLAVAGRVLGWVFGALTGIAVLAAIAIPVFLNQRAAAFQKHDLRPTDARNAIVAELGYHEQFGTFTLMPGLVTHGYTPTPAVTSTVLSADSAHFCLRFAQAGHVAYYDSTQDILGPAPCR